jgi:CubicO group peptidase (beta-lactamase class C family)
MIPELADSGFADATAGDVMDMTVSISYTEEYDPTGDTPDTDFAFADYLEALTDRGDGALRALLARLPKGPRDHGEAFAYATPVTDVLAWLLERAGRAPYVEQLRTRLWARIGAEHDAHIATTPDGTPLAGGGLAMTTRDLARAGIALGDETVVPPGVLRSIRTLGDPDVFRRGGHYDYLLGYSYRDQWWLPAGAGQPLSAWGIFGQLLWIDPDAGMVVALHSGGPDASNERRDLEHDALCRLFVEQAGAWR